MKRHKDLYPKIYDFENLYQAYLAARKGKRFRDDVLEFTNNLEENLITIQNELIWKTYKVGRYYEFFIHEPKKRLIMALPFKDRVVQWAIYRILNPLLDRRYISDSHACRTGYGAHLSAARLQRGLRQLERKHPRVYVLKLDISKYFYRVDHNTLVETLTRIIKDKDLLWLLETIIRAEDKKFGLLIDDLEFNRERITETGMPIGNLTSQMFANLYLNRLDQFIKHELKIKHYLRYMDDMLILHEDKKYLWQIKEDVERFLRENLILETNSKTCVRTSGQGVDWVGYRVWSTHCKLRKSTAQRMKKRLKYLQKTYAKGKVSLEKINATVQSYRGLLEHCDSYNLGKKLFDNLIFVRENKT